MRDPTALLLILEAMPGLTCNPQLCRLLWWRLLVAGKGGRKAALG